MKHCYGFFLSLLLVVSFDARAAAIHDIARLGAKGDGATLDTQTIQDAINGCAPGDTVLIPSGTFISGALFLKSDMTLRIDGTLKGSAHIKDYPLIPCRFAGSEANCYASLVTLGKRDHNGPCNIANVVIAGSGTIDGSGFELGAAEKKASGDQARGRVICMMNAQNITVRGLTVSYGPAWTVHSIYSDNLVFDSLKLISKNSTGCIVNGDGIDPDSCTRVLIKNCYFRTGDDSIAIKSGKNLEGYTLAKPTEHVVVSGCTVDGSNGGIVIGSEMSGSIRDVRVENCKINDIAWDGLDIKSSADRGGVVENITFSNVTISCADSAIRLTTAYKANSGGTPAPVPPVIRNIKYENIICAGGAGTAILVEGLANSKISNVLFQNCDVVSGAGALIDHANGITFSNVTIRNKTGPKFTITNSANVTGAGN